MSFWFIALADGTRVAVRRDPAQLTTYVLLEQEDWFEDEIRFVRRLCAEPGLALDVGANHGVYALCIARAHPDRRVVAFEPTRQAGDCLAAGIAANDLSDRVHWLKQAVADREGEGYMAGTTTPELATLSAAGEETVRVTTLDAWWTAAGEPADVDFIKLDVEGAEPRVLAGAARLLATLSPVVMFEYKHGGAINAGLMDAFRSYGYGIYRLLPGPLVLVPFTSSFDDGYLLNLFAVKPDRAADLARQGLLVAEAPPPAAAEGFLRELAARPYAAPFLSEWAHNPMPETYRRIMAWCVAATGDAWPSEARVAALQTAFEHVQGAEGEADPAWRLLACRISHALGYRARSVALARSVLADLVAGRGPGLPFLPPAPEFDSRPVVDSPGSWLSAVLQEFVLRRAAFSSYFASYGPQELLPLVQNPNHALIGDRMLVLAALRAGGEIETPPHHALFDPNWSPNAALWRQLCFGVLPDTLLGGGDRVHVVDVGASSHGRLTEPYAPLILAQCAQVVGFEPDAAECERLNEMYRNEGFCFLPYFVGRGGPARFHETHWVMTGSLYAPNEAVLRRYEGLYEAVTPKTTHEVQTVSLDALPQVEDIDLLKIDVQGAELDVFQGARRKLGQALVIWTEVEFQPLYARQPLFSEVEQYLRELGFTFYGFDGLACRPLAEAARAGVRTRRPQTLWADAIFIRSVETLPQLSTAKLRRYAVLMEQVVKSQDHAYAALVELDRRGGTDLAPRYARRGPDHWTLAG